MILTDVNVLIYAFRTDTAGHARYHEWLESLINSESVFGMSPQVLSSFIRIVTHPAVYLEPSSVREAIEFSERILSHPRCQKVVPGERHWDIFSRLCTSGDLGGNLIPDAWFAALAIEWGCEWVTTDRDFARFPGLRWRHPLEA